MRLAALSLQPFGAFADLRLSFPRQSSDLHLVVGANAAGKSTVRAALSALLFGVPERKDAFDFVHHKHDLRVGGVLERAEERLSARRRSGRKATLLDADDTPIQEALLQTWLGDVDRATFERTFSLDSPALRQGGQDMVNARDDVGRVLFEASAGLTGLGTVLQELDDAADAAFSTGRARQSRNYDVAKKRYDEAVRREREAVLRPDAYLQRERAAKEAQARQREAEKRLDAARRTRTSQARRLRLAGPLRDLPRIQAELEALGPLPNLPDDIVSIVADHRRATVEREARLDLGRDGLRQTEADFAALPSDDGLLSAAKELRALQRRAEALADGRHDEETAEADLAALRAAALRHGTAAGLDMADTEALKERLPVAATLNQWRRELDALPALEDATAQTARDLGESHRIAEETQAALAALGPPRAVDHLALALADAQDWRRAQDRLSENQAEREGIKSELDVALRRLVPAPSSLQALQSMQGVVEHDLASFEQVLTGNKAALAEAQAAVDRMTAETATANAAVAELQGEVGEFDAAELRRVRAERDMRWQKIRDLETWPPDAAAKTALDRAIDSADRIADARFDSAAEVGRLRQLELELARHAAAQREAAAARTKAEQALEQAVVRWREELDARSLPQLQPAELRAWQKQRDDILALAGKLETLDARIDADARVIATATAALAEVLAGQDVSIPLDVSFRACLAMAEESLKAWTDTEARRPSLLEETSRAQLRVDAATTSDQAAKQALLAAQTNVDAIAQALGRPPSTAAALLADLLARIEAAAAAMDDANRLEAGQLQPIRRRRQSLEDDCRHLAQQVARPIRGDEAPLDWLRRTLDELDGQERAASQRQQAERKIVDDKARIDDFLTQQRVAEAALQPIFERAGVDDLDRLDAVLAALAQARELRKQETLTLSRLAEIAPGTSVEAAREEVADAEPAALQAELDALDAAEERLTADLRAADTARAEADAALAATAGRADAADARADRALAETAMLDAVADYLDHRLQAMVLRWGLEKFRETEQDPMLKRASELFQKLSLGEFERLVIDPTDSPPKLWARRPKGQLVGLEGLSAGTVDQLFLALRLAALERDLDAGRLLPFIADDLFERFSDERTAAGFEVLADLAERTQVIVFTHHHHLIDIAKTVLGSDRLSISDLAVASSNSEDAAAQPSEIAANSASA